MLLPAQRRRQGEAPGSCSRSRSRRGGLWRSWRRH